MARKYMKVKKLTLSILTVALLTSQLVGCALISEDNLIHEVNEGSQIEVEVALPDESGNSGTLGIEDSIVYGDTNDVEYIVTLDNLPDELLQIFKDTYNNTKGICEDIEEQISFELGCIPISCERLSVRVPDNLDFVYVEWRNTYIASLTPEAPTPPQEQTQAQFKEVNETVYATSKVNTRTGPGTTHDKVGQITKGTKVTRTGIGQGDAEGWSRVQLSDGSIVYVSSNYLSTTKPVTPSTGSNNSTGGVTQGSGGSTSNQGNYDIPLPTRPGSEKLDHDSGGDVSDGPGFIEGEYSDGIYIGG